MEEVWTNGAPVTIGEKEGTLHNASQPSIIMHPESAMPTGPRRTHITSTASVTRRAPFMPCEYPAGPPPSQVLASKTIGASVSSGGAACHCPQAAPHALLFRPLQADRIESDQPGHSIRPW